MACGALRRAGLVVLAIFLRGCDSRSRRALDGSDQAGGDAGVARRYHFGVAQLGLGVDPSSACAFDRARRWHLARWHALDAVPAGLLPAGARALALVPSMQKPSQLIWRRCAKLNGSSMRSAHSVGPRRCSLISRATPTAISCLGASRTSASRASGWVIIPASEKPAHLQTFAAHCLIWPARSNEAKLPDAAASVAPRQAGGFRPPIPAMERTAPIRDAITARATRAAFFPNAAFPRTAPRPPEANYLSAPGGLPVPCPSRTRYFCSPVMTHSPRWLWMVDATVSTPVLRCGVSAAMVSRGYSVSPA